MTELTSAAKIEVSDQSPAIRVMPGKLNTPALMAKAIEIQTGQKPKLSKESITPKLDVFTINAQYFKKPMEQIVQNKTYIDIYLSHIEATRIQKKIETQ